MTEKTSETTPAIFSLLDSSYAPLNPHTASLQVIGRGTFPRERLSQPLHDAMKELHELSLKSRRELVSEHHFEALSTQESQDEIQVTAAAGTMTEQLQAFPRGISPQAFDETGEDFEDFEQLLLEMPLESETPRKKDSMDDLRERISDLNLSGRLNKLTLQSREPQETSVDPLKLDLLMRRLDDLEEKEPPRDAPSTLLESAAKDGKKSFAKTTEADIAQKRSLREIQTQTAESVTKVERATTIEEKYVIGLFVALGLAKLHELGLCHMNVKPSHVELGRNKKTGKLRARLLDAGSVVLCGSRNIPSVTPQYMDLEGISTPSEKKAAFADDMWSLGLLLYELMYGRAKNPLRKLDLRRLSEETKKTWAFAITKIRDTLSKEKPIDRLICALLQSEKERPTAQQVVVVLSQSIGEKRCSELVTSEEIAYGLERILRPICAKAYLPKNRGVLSQDECKTLCRLMHFLVLSLQELHKSKKVHMNITPEFVQLFWDRREGALSSQLSFSPGCVPEGSPLSFSQMDLRYIDFNQQPGLSGRKALFSDDLWALGLTMLELAYGRRANPFRFVAWNEREDRVDTQAWDKAVKKIAERECKNSLDELILRLLERNPERRPTLDQVDHVLREILNVETADGLLEALQNEHEYGKRVIVALEVAKDFQEKIPYFYLNITPHNIQLVRDSKSEELIGARLVREIPRADVASSLEQVSGAQNRTFGLLLFSFFHEANTISSKIDFENIPAESSKEWKSLLHEVKKQLDLQKMMDTTIWKLLSDSAFSIQLATGPLQFLFERGRVI